MGKSKFLSIEIPDDELDWVLEEDKKYKYHATLKHKPTGITIEQASERNMSRCKNLCLKYLKWKIYEKNNV
tara:strand:- start:19 stop:231 length:213 start_codon:yes stop_codon:yes gene_type:complete